MNTLSLFRLLFSIPCKCTPPSWGCFDTSTTASLFLLPSVTDSWGTGDVVMTTLEKVCQTAGRLLFSDQFQDLVWGEDIFQNCLTEHVRSWLNVYFNGSCWCFDQDAAQQGCLIKLKKVLNFNRNLNFGTLLINFYSGRSSFYQNFWNTGIKCSLDCFWVGYRLLVTWRLNPA